MLFRFSLLLSLFLFFSIAHASKPVELSEKELQWIKEHPVIRVANEMDWPPFDFNEYEKPKGLAIDHIRLLAKKTGLKIKFINGYTWAELLELFENKKIDVMPVMYKNAQREEYTLFTKPYYRGKLGVFANSENREWDGVYKNRRVGIEKSHGSIPIIQKQNSDLELIEVANILDLVTMLATKKLDLIIGNPLAFYYYAKENQINNIELAGFVNMSQAEQLKTSFHIGVRNDMPILHQILQKSMQDVSDVEMESIESRWTDIVIIKEIDWIFVSKALGSVGLIIFLLSWHNRRLQSMVNKKTHELQELNINLEQKVELRTKELMELNKELESLVHKDPMTNAYNRRYFYDVAQEILSLSKREEINLSIAMLDIDDFKNINDTFGHDIGDKAILFIVEEVIKIIRASDIFARFGGEEFIILFPNTDIDGAVTTLEKIRELVADSVIEDNVILTLSAGVTELSRDDEDIDAIIKRADIALYNAKNSGKNRVEVYL